MISYSISENIVELCFCLEDVNNEIYVNCRVVVKTKGIQKLKREQRWGSGSLCPHKELGPPVFPLVGQKDKMITEIYLFLKAVILCVTHFMETLASVAQ